VTKIMQAETLKFAESDAADRLIAAIQELSLAGDLDTIAEIVRRTAREISGADGATFVLRDGELCHYVDEDAIGPLWKGRRFPMHACITGWVMKNRRAEAIENIYADRRIPADVYRPTFVKSLVVVPIRTVDPIGAIGNYWASPHKASAEEIRSLQALADATAVAMDRARLHQELEQRVRERTAELEAANRRLAAETKERREAEQNLQTREAEARSVRLQRDHLAAVLASGMAHELNQPLSAVNTYIGFALKMLRGDGGASAGIELVDAMEKAEAENWRAVKTVRKFREALRRGEPDLRAIDLNAVIRSAAALLEEEAREAGIALYLDLDDSLQAVRCDRDQIDHVVLNLMRNALDAMREAASRGSLQVRTRPARRGFMQVSVIDDGPGLSGEVRDNLFTPFYTNKAKGLGLGLSVSRNIVEAHGGELWADCDRQSGAAFHLTLPGVQQAGV